MTPRVTFVFFSVFAFQIILCTFFPFVIFPLIYFVPDEHHEREAAARLSQKSLTSKSKSMKSLRRGSGGKEGVELQRIEPVNGNVNNATDEEANVGSDGEDLVDYIPGTTSSKYKFKFLVQQCSYKSL